MPACKHVGANDLDPFSVNFNGVAIEVFLRKCSIDVDSSKIGFSFLLVEVLGFVDAFVQVEFQFIPEL